MHLKTILNHGARFKGFIYGKERFETYQGRTVVVVSLRPRQGEPTGVQRVRPGWFDLRSSADPLV